jgi:transcriptional regulator with XRE-family HTH domain
MSQPEISRLERQKVIDGERLQQISDILGISPEVIITFDVNKTISTINASPAGQNKRVTGKPDLSEKIVELYERLLESEREKGKLMEQHGETYRTKN